MPRFDMMDLLQAEMRLERTSALARVGEKLQRSIDELKAIEARHQKAPGDEARRRLAQQHAELRKKAEDQRFCLVVQREAMGMTNQQIVDEIYPIPPPLR